MMTLTPRAAPLLLALLLTVALAACGNDDDNDEAPVDVDIPVGEPASEVPDGGALIDQENIAFAPDSVTVSVGEPIYLHNNEGTPHTVTINGENVSGTMEEGDLIAWEAPATGTYEVTCDFHPEMAATITVTE